MKALTLFIIILIILFQDSLFIWKNQKCTKDLQDCDESRDMWKQSYLELNCCSYKQLDTCRHMLSLMRNVYFNELRRIRMKKNNSLV